MGYHLAPFLVNATIRYRLEVHLEEHPVVVERLSKSFCVDDVITGASSEGEAFSLYRVAKKILKAGGFNLRKFSRNAVMLQVKIDSCESPCRDEETDSVPVPIEETYASIFLGSTQSVLQRWLVCD